MSRTRVTLYAIGSLLTVVALVFLPIGRMDWIPDGIFIAVPVAAFGCSALLVALVNPVVYRAHSRFHPGTKR